MAGERDRSDGSTKGEGADEEEEEGWAEDYLT